MYIIVAGCGRLGSSLAYDLSNLGHDVCIIDRDKEKLSVLGSGFNGQRVNGIEFDSDNLKKCGIEQANSLLAVTSDDNINITLSLIANKIYHVPQVIARVNDPNRKYIYETLNIEIISPVQLGAELLINRLDVKKCDLISKLDENYDIIELLINRKISITVAEIEQKFSCVISGIRRSENIILPQRDTLLQIGDRLICTIHKNDKPKLLRLFSKEMPVWNP
nr:TrkA family potassium uptake protein [uncultured Caproiciproducens sp.]